MIEIALYEPQIPQNTGNIARLCVGLDIPLNLVGKLGFSLNDKYMKRAGLDYWEHLKVQLYNKYENFESKTLKQRKIFATTKGILPYYDFKFEKGDIIIFGSETSGVPMDLLKKNFENAVTIPMPGKVRSLNLSNSAAIVSYFALERLGYFKDFKRNNNLLTLP